MTEQIICPSFLVAKALSRLQTFYWVWEQYRNSSVPPLRRHAIAAKAHGLVWHDRTLAIRAEVRHD